MIAIMCVEIILDRNVECNAEEAIGLQVLIALRIYIYIKFYGQRVLRNGTSWLLRQQNASICRLYRMQHSLQFFLVCN